MKIDISHIFAYLVLTIILTCLIFVFLNSGHHCQFPILEKELTHQNKKNLLISLGISLGIVLIFMIIQSRN